MAEWIKIVDNSYVRMSALQRVYVTSPDGLSWEIAGIRGASADILILRGGFASQAAAQTALDGAIANNGGFL